MSILHTPLTVKGLELKNRLVMPPMASARTSDGSVTQELCDYYAARTSGGCLGLVITEHSYISPEGKASANQVSISKDEDVEGLRRLVAAIHADGTPTIAQINHAGGAAKPEVTGCRVLAPSAVALPRKELVPEEMTREDLRNLVQSFAAAALRAKQAGYDGVEIHSAHGYLLNQFYSPLTNHRTDEYGGTRVQDRLRIHLEVIEAVRKTVGADYPVALRLGACDYMEGGSTLEDAVEAAKLLEDAGVDLLDISGGFCGYVRPGVTGEGYFAEMTAAIKKAVRIPVILTGGVVSASGAEKLLREDAADLIGVGRAIFKDADWARNAMREEI